MGFCLLLSPVQIYGNAKASEADQMQVNCRSNTPLINSERSLKHHKLLSKAPCIGQLKLINIDPYSVMAITNFKCIYLDLI